MVPTRTTAWLLTAGLLLWLAALVLSALPPEATTWLPAGLAPAARWLVFAFDAALLLLFLLDATFAWRALGPARLALRRERPARLSLGTDNEIALVLDNRGGRGLR